MEDEYVGLAVGVLAVVSLVLFLLGIGLYVISSIFLMKMFEKAGVQGKWRAWVPVYNLMIFFKLGDFSPWLVLHCVIASFVLAVLVGLPVVGIVAGTLASLLSVALAVVSLLAAYRIGMKFGKEGAWVVLYFFLPLVWMGILGLSAARWNPNIPRASWVNYGFLADTTVWAAVPAQPVGPAATGYAATGYAAPAQAYGAQQPHTAPGAYGAPQQPYAAPGPYGEPQQPSLVPGAYAVPPQPYAAPGTPLVPPQSYEGAGYPGAAQPTYEATPASNVPPQPYAAPPAPVTPPAVEFAPAPEVPLAPDAPVAPPAQPRYDGPAAPPPPPPAP